MKIINKMITGISALKLASALVVLLAVNVALAAPAAKVVKPRKVNPPVPPDLTQGGQYDSEEIDWNLGATGARGWTWGHPHVDTDGAKQIYITKVDAGAPASGVLKVGDVILGVNGKSFQRDARKEFGFALGAAESPEQAGKLSLIVWNAGQTREATLSLKVMGATGEGTPFDQSKSKRIMDEAVAHMLKTGLGGGVAADINALGLLATGREDVMPIVRAHAQKIAAEGRNLQFKQAQEAWHWGYHNILLSEYYLATRDATVLPAIREYATKISMGQSLNGNWGHSMCMPYYYTGGTIYGVTPGYGALNQAGLACMISLALAKKCGVENAEINLAIKRGSDFFRYYLEKGAVPYGDHQPEEEGFEDNGKTSLAAVYFDLIGEPAPATFFTKMTIASYNEREPGHTGNYFCMLWGPLAAARGGDAAAAAFMQRMAWFFDLERRRQGEFIYQGKPNIPKGHYGENTYCDWDCTGARLLAYSLPLKKIYLTGKGRTVQDLVGQELAETVAAGSLLRSDYVKLSTGELLAKLSDCLPPVRARAAKALGEKPDNVVNQLIAQLDSPNRYARYGACQALSCAGRNSAAAVDALVAKGLSSTDETMLFFTIKAFATSQNTEANWQEMGLSKASNRVLPTLLKLATDDKLSRRLKNILASSLFYSGSASGLQAVARNGEGLKQVDSDLVVRSIRELLQVDYGGGRSSVASAYENLTDAQLKLLWKDIYRAVRVPANADIMFSGGVRLAGLKLMAKHHTQEGLETGVWLLTNQKPHGAEKFTKDILRLGIQPYGGYAKAYIPQLEKAANYLEQDFYKSPAAAAEVREAIQQIRNAPTPAWQPTSIAEYLK